MHKNLAWWKYNNGSNERKYIVPNSNKKLNFHYFFRQ